MLAEFINSIIGLLCRLADVYHHIHKLKKWATACETCTPLQLRKKIQFFYFLSQAGKYRNVVFSFPSLRKYWWPSLIVPPAVLGQYSPDRSLNPMVSWITWKPLEFFPYPVFTIMGYSTTEAVPSLKKLLGSSSRQKQGIYAFQLLWDTRKILPSFHY